MKTITSIFLSIYSSCLFGQDITKFYDYKWKECRSNMARFYAIISSTDSGYVRKDYFIHSKTLQMAGKYSDRELKVRNGNFYYFHANGSLDASGKYKNDKKDGLWLHYYPNKMLMDSGVYSNGNIVGTRLSWHINGYLKDSTVMKINGKGVQVAWFDNGNTSSAGYLTNYTKPSGIWKYYHKNGQVSSKETYQNEVLINKLYYNDKGEMLSDTTTKDRNASFIGGNKAWQKYLLKQVYFPNGFEIVNADRAAVVVSFTVSEDGKVEDVVVSTPLYPEFDKIAKEALINSPDWLPAINHNRKEKSRIIQAVIFAN